MLYFHITAGVIPSGMVCFGLDLFLNQHWLLFMFSGKDYPVPFISAGFFGNRSYLFDNDLTI